MHIVIFFYMHMDNEIAHCVASSQLILTSADDRRHLEAFMHCTTTLGYCKDSTLTFDSICTKADEKLFSSITGSCHHLLHPLLPPQHEQHYSLRDRSHNLQLPTRTSSLKDNNFFIHMLFKDITFTCAFCQWLYFILYYSILNSGLSLILLKHNEWMNFLDGSYYM